jgi:formate dehydrogenase subunit gamma
VHLTGQTQVRGVETGVLITQTGEEFRNYRRNDFIGNAGLVIAAAAGVILLFYLIRGRMRIPGGRSGKRIKRFEDFDRTVHWLVAILFIFLALTGLILLFGRFIVLPVFGAEAFGLIASACKEGHNLFGPVFLVSLVLLFLRFVAKNLPARGDLKWLLKGGGMIGKGHVSAGYFNAGEKAWFWGVTVLGLTVSLTGLVLIFPILGQGREVMQLALIVHGLAAVLFIAGSFGHIYIGTLGMEGSLESMTTGYVDEHWAEAHHDRWYAEVKGLSDPTDTGTSDRAASGGLHPTPDKA